jgi:hypothetical protein
MQQCDLHYVQGVLIHEININTPPTITNTVTTTIIIIVLSIVSVVRPIHTYHAVPMLFTCNAVPR